MLFTKKIDIADNERAFLYKNRRLTAVLTPGRHRFMDWNNSIYIEHFNISNYELEHTLGKFLVSTYAGLTREHLQSYQLTDNEVGLCYIDGKLMHIVAPGEFRLYWKGPEQVSLQKVDISQEYQISNDHLALLARNHSTGFQRLASQAVYYTEVEDNHVGMLLVNGKLEQVLQPGSYGFWKFHRNIAVKHIDLRMQNMEVSGQEILTRDRVSLRLNLSAVYRVTDAEKASRSLVDYQDYLYREFQLQLREAVGTRTLDELLNNKDVLNEIIGSAIVKKIDNYGIEVKSVGVRDIILPGEMKVILNQVVEAEKSAEANLIKRREETAATRSLHNTAKMMENNPTLMRLKELEVLEKVTERIGSITVHNGLEGMLKDLVKLSP